MKVLKEPKIYLSDILKTIIYIQICEDVNRIPRTIAASDDISMEDWLNDQMDSDEVLLGLPDDALKKLSQDRINLIQSGALLHKLYDLCPEKFDDILTERLRKYYSKTKFDICDEDIITFIDKLKSCQHVLYNRGRKHTDTDDFILDSGKHVREQDCLRVLKNITLEDYHEGLIGADPRYFRDNLIVFRTHQNWTTFAGELLDDIFIYVKLDIDKSNGDCIVIVSFHESTEDDE